MTRCKLGDLNSRYSFLTVLEVGMFKVMVLRFALGADLQFAGGYFPAALTTAEKEL